MPPIAAVIATCNRPQLLAERSLPSVARQTRLPDLLIVVDDSEPHMRSLNREAVSHMPNAIYLENRRTPGAAGAWNTALSHLQDVEPSSFVAILDDDDSWDPHYLHTCEEAATKCNLDMAASGITYHGPDAQKLLDPPDRLVVNDLLVGNTNIQGSNIFARLRRLLEAGGFDEEMASTTDRDMCIRLADLGTVAYGPVSGHPVHHYADNDRPRLSKPGSRAKRLGLEYFFRKYRGRMSVSEESAFMRRSRRVFGCEPQAPVAAPPVPHTDVPVDGHLDLVVGAITSPDVAQTARLLDSLTRSIYGDVTLKVVLLENAGQTSDVLPNMIKQSKLDITLKRTGKSERLSIAAARTILQRHLFVEAAARPGAVVWILDDDIILESLEYGPDCMRPRHVDYVSAIKRLKDTGVAVVICQETGDPPLPAASCMRTQLVDLYHTLHRMACLRPDDPYPNLSGENRISRLDRRDYYYDLSRSETSHLEIPFWYEADGNAAQVFTNMVSRLPHILSGIQIFRPLTRAESGDRMIPSTNRGPATLVFDIDALRDFPNTVPNIHGVDTRRGDMVWCILNRYSGGRRIVRAPLPVRQARKATGPRMSISHILQDIRGHALYSALQDMLAEAEERQDAQASHALHFDESQIQCMVELYKGYVRERAHAFELNFIRIRGVLSALRNLCSTAPWWLEYAGPAAKLQEFITSISDMYTNEWLDEFRRRIADVDAKDIRRYVHDLPEAVDRHRAHVQSADSIRDAHAHVQSEFATGPLECLGMGGEGICLTDGQMVYKHFHPWRMHGDQITRFRSLAGRLSGYKTLPNIREVRQKGIHTVAAYPYEEGTTYKGGHLDGLLALLRECNRAKIACRNIHPDNLLVTGSGLRLIDFGADIVETDDAEFDQMCRRALLTWRLAFRSDLKQLMRRALHGHTPELTGINLFKNAVEPRGLDELFYDPLEEIVAESQPGSVMDYGCGDGRLAERLAGRGMEVAGYDPCLKKPPVKSLASYGGVQLRERLLADSTRFDTVVCSRVLCTISDDAEFDHVLHDLRRLAAGDILVAVCNPFYYDARTELAERCPAEGLGYGDQFTYDKILAVNGRRRPEVHRNCASYRRAFARAGLVIREMWEFDGTDTRAVLPASDHLVFRLASLATSRVSLLIKTCVSEWRLIERMVRHLVRQLEGPRSFAEKVIVVDSNGGPFRRQYGSPDPAAHRAAMERLLCDGVVDRVVYAPADARIIRSTYQRWFGVQSEETHSANGQQLFATLFGFDSCTGDYVLQVDSDLLIVRLDHEHDYTSEMEDVLCRDPEALFVSLNICRSKTEPYTHEDTGGSWRVEVRGCMYDRRRVESVLPIHNRMKDGRFELAWHRAFDQGGCRSYRGGDPRTAFIHAPNCRKRDTDGLLDIMGAVERGYVPEVQRDRVELTGSAGDWAGAHRVEPYVFVVCGRNVEHGRLKRCIESMVGQRGAEWGAVVIDDASTNGMADHAEVLLADYKDRVTLIRNERRRGAIYNIWNAVTQVCTNPETVILTLDADDALAGSHVLERVRAEYDGGADATVGTMLRLDKEASCPVNFDEPRRWDSNVWQHLRTFKKRLFDAIGSKDLKVDGEWIDQANDWAFMVPIIEMASSPRHIPDQLYVYEPAVPKNTDHRQDRDRMIGRILSKAPYCRQD